MSASGSGKKAKASKAKCFHCSTPIPEASIRFRYRHKPGTTVRDEGFLHPACIGHMPEVAKAFDVSKLRFWEAKADDADLKATFANAADLRA